VVFTVDQAYRIKSNRALLTRPVAAIVGATSVSSDGGGEWLEVDCECSAQHCGATLVVLRGDYERLRPERRELLVAVDHELDSPVRVILRTDAYELVELLGL
jgi:hypothetical protein